MIVSIGIDPSTTATGIIVVKGDLGTPPTCVLEKELKIMALKSYERVEAICDGVMSVIEDHNPDVVTIEGYGLNMKHASSVIPLVELGGIMRAIMWKSGIKYLSPTPPELKKFVTGKGNANKDIVMMQVFKHWKFEAKSNNTADAFALATMGLAWKGALRGVTINQRTVVGALKLN